MQFNVVILTHSGPRDHEIRDLKKVFVKSLEKFNRLFRKCKVGHIFSMVIASEFLMGQHRDDDHQEDAPKFTKKITVNY